MKFKLNKITRTVLFLALARGEFTISGVHNKALRARFPQYSSGQMSRILRRLGVPGLVQKARHCYKYYLTMLGQQAIATALKLKDLVIIPELAAVPRTDILPISART